MKGETPQGAAVLPGNVLRLPALAAPDPVDMPFEFPAVEQFREHILLKGRHRAAVKPCPKLKDGQERPGQHHISHAEGRGNGPVYPRPEDP